MSTKIFPFSPKKAERAMKAAARRAQEATDQEIFQAVTALELESDRAKGAAKLAAERVAARELARERRLKLEAECSSFDNIFDDILLEEAAKVWWEQANEYQKTLDAMVSNEARAEAIKTELHKGLAAGPDSFWFLAYWLIKGGRPPYESYMSGQPEDLWDKAAQEQGELKLNTPDTVFALICGNRDHARLLASENL